MAQQSARRDQENQGFPLCFEHAVGDLDRIRELPYRPAVFERPHQQAGQMAASDYVSEIPENHSCAEGGVHRWKADIGLRPEIVPHAFHDLSLASPPLVIDRWLP
jgi:hypothetical protein